MRNLGVIGSSMIVVAIFALVMIAHPPLPEWLAWVPWEVVILLSFLVLVGCIALAWTVRGPREDRYAGRQDAAWRAGYEKGAEEGRRAAQADADATAPRTKNRHEARW